MKKSGALKKFGSSTNLNRSVSNVQQAESGPQSTSHYESRRKAFFNEKAGQDDNSNNSSQNNIDTNKNKNQNHNRSQYLSDKNEAAETVRKMGEIMLEEEEGEVEETMQDPEEIFKTLQTGSNDNERKKIEEELMEWTKEFFPEENKEEEELSTGRGKSLDDEFDEMVSSSKNNTIEMESEFVQTNTNPYFPKFQKVFTHFQDFSDALNNILNDFDKDQFVTDFVAKRLVLTSQLLRKEIINIENHEDINSRRKDDERLLITQWMKGIHAIEKHQKKKKAPSSDVGAGFLKNVLTDDQQKAIDKIFGSQEDSDDEDEGKSVLEDEDEDYMKAEVGVQTVVSSSFINDLQKQIFELKQAEATKDMQKEDISSYYISRLRNIAQKEEKRKDSMTDQSMQVELPTENEMEMQNEIANLKKKQRMAKIQEDLALNKGKPNPNAESDGELDNQAVQTDLMGIDNFLIMQDKNSPALNKNPPVVDGSKKTITMDEEEFKKEKEEAKQVFVGHLLSCLDSVDALNENENSEFLSAFPPELLSRLKELMELASIEKKLKNEDKIIQEEMLKIHMESTDDSTQTQGGESTINPNMDDNVGGESKPKKKDNSEENENGGRGSKSPSKMQQKLKDKLKEEGNGKKRANSMSGNISEQDKEKLQRASLSSPDDSENDDDSDPNKPKKHKTQTLERRRSKGEIARNILLEESENGGAKLKAKKNPDPQVTSENNNASPGSPTSKQRAREKAGNLSARKVSLPPISPAAPPNVQPVQETPRSIRKKLATTIPTKKQYGMPTEHVLEKWNQRREQILKERYMNMKMILKCFSKIAYSGTMFGFFTSLWNESGGGQDDETKKIVREVIDSKLKLDVKPISLRTHQSPPHMQNVMNPLHQRPATGATDPRSVSPYISSTQTQQNNTRKMMAIRNIMSANPSILRPGFDALDETSVSDPENGGNPYLINKSSLQSSHHFANAHFDDPEQYNGAAPSIPYQNNSWASSSLSFNNYNFYSTSYNISVQQDPNRPPSLLAALSEPENNQYSSQNDKKKSVSFLPNFLHTVKKDEKERESQNMKLGLPQNYNPQNFNMTNVQPSPGATNTIHSLIVNSGLGAPNPYSNLVPSNSTSRIFSFPKPGEISKRTKEELGNPNNQNPYAANGGQQHFNTNLQQYQNTLQTKAEDKNFFDPEYLINNPQHPNFQTLYQKIANPAYEGNGTTFFRDHIRVIRSGNK